jgi:hypothetical protein
VQVGYATPLKIHPDNPRYFQDSTGKALYFAGSSTWFVLQENGHRADKKRITEFLDWLKAWGHNYTRVWSYFFYMNNNKGAQKPWPYMRTGPGLANDELPKFDLKKMNAQYVDMVRYFLEEAEKREIFCSIMLFGSFNGFRKYESLKNRVAWYPDNNISVGEESLKIGKDFFSMTPDLLALQEGHVRRVIDQFNHFDNLVWEIINEAELPASKEWQYHMTRYIRHYEKTKPKQHLIIMSGGHDEANGILEESPADIISPDSSTQNYKDGGPPSYDDKIVVNDTDHLWGYSSIEQAEDYRKWVWKTFLRGNHAVFMDDYDSFVNGNKGQVNPAYDLVRKNLGYTVDYSKRFWDLGRMLPDTEIASTKYALINDGREYLVYFPDEKHNGAQAERTLPKADSFIDRLWFKFFSKTNENKRSFSVHLRKGTYNREWFDPTDSIKIKDRLFCDEDGPMVFSIPGEMTGDVLVYIQRIHGPE